jgi:hypothetical protein
MTISLYSRLYGIRYLNLPGHVLVQVELEPSECERLHYAEVGVYVVLNANRSE